MRIALITILLLTVKVLTFELNVTKQIPKRLIYKGKLYDVDDYPYVVSITIAYPQNIQETCAGSLINKLLVLTSAYCVYDIDTLFIKVYQGTWLHNSISRKVVNKFIHDDYDPDNKEYIIGDISVLKIDKPFPRVKEFIKIGGIPDDFADEKVLDCKVFGFGLINEQNVMGSEGFMNNVKVKHGKTACQPFNSKAIKNTWEQYLCPIPGPNSTCEGDNGGPMVCNGLLYGVCSFAMTFDGEREIICGSEHLQTVHMFTYYYKKWIYDIIDSVKSKDLDITTKKPKIKKKKKSAGELIKPHHTLYMISALLFYYIACN